MLDQKTINDICDHAAVSDLAKVNWQGRGKAPIGFIKGLACTYGLCLQKLAAKDSAALAMVRIVDGEHDVFDHYEGQLIAAGLETNAAPDVERLRALFVILTGLGMRESSGRYCCGRDTTAKIPPSSDTVEAGLFQQSWDSRRASPEIEKVFHNYNSSVPDAIDGIFKVGVTPQNRDLENVGRGDGYTFQALCKAQPTFAVQVAAIGLRTLYTHWGPIVRREAELRPEAVALFRQVEEIVGAVKPDVPVADSSSWFRALVGIFARLFGRKGEPKPTIDPPVTKQDATPWMTWAAKEVGFHETGTNLNIGRYTAPAKCGQEGDPWCAIFVNAALESSGIHGSRSAMARSFERDPNFVRLSGPAFGAITTMWRGSPGSGLGHVFFYLGESDRGILALGGNQSDQVCRQYEPRARVFGYYWPKSIPLPKVGKIIVESDADEGTET